MSDIRAENALSMFPSAPVAFWTKNRLEESEAARAVRGLRSNSTGLRSPTPLEGEKEIKVAVPKARRIQPTTSKALPDFDRRSLSKVDGHLKIQRWHSQSY